MEKQPSPGSKEAQKAGCLCPVIDNHYGKGIRWEDVKVVFYMNVDCPLHVSKKIKQGLPGNGPVSK